MVLHAFSLNASKAISGSGEWEFRSSDGLRERSGIGRSCAQQGAHKFCLNDSCSRLGNTRKQRNIRNAYEWELLSVALGSSLATEALRTTFFILPTWLSNPKRDC